MEMRDADKDDKSECAQHTDPEILRNFSDGGNSPVDQKSRETSRQHADQRCAGNFQYQLDRPEQMELKRLVNKNLSEPRPDIRSITREPDASGGHRNRRADHELKDKEKRHQSAKLAAAV